MGSPFVLLYSCLHVRFRRQVFSVSVYFKKVKSFPRKKLFNYFAFPSLERRNRFFCGGEEEQTKTNLNCSIRFIHSGSRKGWPSGRARKKRQHQ